MKKYSMLTDSPGKSLFYFALPMILGNLFQQFYSMVDSIIVGQFVGEDALAAVGASYSLTTVFIMIAIGGGIGASVITSQYLGAALYRKMKTSVYTALISFLSVSILLGCFGLAFGRGILTALHTPENILADAMLYLEIYFLGLPFLFMYNILSSVFNALGNSRTPLYLLIFSSLLNIVMDLALVWGCGFGIGGAAVATVIAQGISAVISFLLLMGSLKNYGQEGQGEEMAKPREELRMAQEKAGRIYSGDADRVCVHSAYDSFRQRSFHIYCPEPWGRVPGTGEKGVFCGGQDGSGIWGGDLPGAEPVP